jgi:hypothetical protein
MRKLIIAGWVALPALCCAPADAQQNPQKVWSFQAPLVSLGYCQLTGVATATALSACSGGIPTMPAGTVFYAFIIPESAIRLRDDGTAPTATVGMPVAANQPYMATVNPLSNVQMIPQSGTATIDVMFYGVR